MLTIVINAYAVCPNRGSEQGVGWNFVNLLAPHCRLHVITEAEYSEQVAQALAAHPHGSNVTMHYVAVTPEVRRMCWNQGDWRFYHFYKQWQRRAAQVAREICGREKVDVLHQLNMVGFREPGYLWKVARATGIPFVWGPIGGLKRFPMRYAKGGGWKMQLFLRIKNGITTLQIRFGRRVHHALHTAKCLLSTIPDSRDAILRYHGLESIVMPETGCWDTGLAPVRRSASLPLRLLWVGKFDFRKRLDLALLTMARLKDLSVVLDVYGTGNEQQTTASQALAAELGIADKVHFMGSRPNEEVHQAMREADLFFFTSVSEDTSTVVPEAIDSCLPVLCFDACGMAYVVDATVGIKVSLTRPEDSIEAFASHIRHLATHREELHRLSQGCIERKRFLSWQTKAETLLKIYEKLVHDERIAAPHTKRHV